MDVSFSEPMMYFSIDIFDPVKIAAFPIGAGDFASLVRCQISCEPPAAGDLPGGEFGRKKFGEGGDGDFFFCVYGGNDCVGTVGVILSVLDAEDDALENGGMSAEDGFDGFRGGFASGDVEEIGGAAVEVDGLIAEFGEVGGFEAAGSEWLVVSGWW